MCLSLFPDLKLARLARVADASGGACAAATERQRTLEGSALLTGGLQLIFERGDFTGENLGAERFDRRKRGHFRFGRGREHDFRREGR